jgi:N6-adenosine-specific RNA methylase IME4
VSVWEGLNPPYSTIVADPPWDYGSTFTPKNAGEEWQKGAECPYSMMGPDEVAAVPVRDLAATDAHLYLWVTNRFMEQGHVIARAWGFKPKTILTWGKVQSDGSPSMKVGHWFRSATEHVIFATRGSLPRKSTEAISTLMLWPRIAAHSVKPAAFGDLVEQVSPGPYVELFARQPRLGWDHWGHGYEMGGAA